MDEQTVAAGAQAARGDLERLVKVGQVTPEVLEGCEGLEKLVLDTLKLHGALRPGGRGELLFETLKGVVEEHRREAFRRRTEFTQSSASITLCCQVAAAAELLSLTDDVSEEFKKFRLKQIGGVTWANLVANQDKKTPAAVRQLGAALWLWSSNPRTAASDRRGPELLEALQQAIPVYIQRESERFKLLVLTYLNESELTPTIGMSTTTFKSPSISAKVEAAPSARLLDVKLQALLDEIAKVVHIRLREERFWQHDQDSYLLTTSYRNADPTIMDHWSRVRHSLDSKDEPILLDGTLKDISDRYLKIPSGRLVVLGEGGSGKSILIRELAISLLEKQTRPFSAPILLDIGSWNAARQSLQSWISDAYSSRYGHNLFRRKKDATSTVSEILRTGAITLILDGFDEVEQARRVSIIKALNMEAHRQQIRFVLASRPQEYADAIGADRYLFGAAAVTMNELGFSEVSSFLRLAGRKVTSDDTVDTMWGPVLARLENPVDSHTTNLLQTLSTPLMTSLAAAIYRSGNRDPAELLDNATFREPLNLRNHFLDQYIDIVYPYSPIKQERKGKQRWSPTDARKWIGYLAARLTAERERYIAWWLFPYYEFRLKLTFAVASLGFILQLAILARAPVRTDDGLGYVSHELFAACAIFAVVFTNTVAIDYSPRRIRTRSWSRKVAWPKHIIGYEVVGFIFLIIIPTAALAAVVPLDKLNGGNYPSTSVVAMAFVFAPFCVVPFLCPINTDPSCSLNVQVRQDRNSALLRGVLYGLASVAAFSTALLVDQRQVSLPWIIACFLTTFTLTMSSSAWWFWKFATFYMALRGRSAVRIVGFWQDAHERGVLRREGRYYRFRHTFLQERLAEIYSANSQSSMTSLTRLRSRVGLAVLYHEDADMGTPIDQLRNLLQEPTVPLFGLSRFRFEVWTLLIHTLRRSGEAVEAALEAERLKESQTYRRLRWDPEKRYEFLQHYIDAFVAAEKYGGAIEALRSAIRLKKLQHSWIGGSRAEIQRMEKMVEQLRQKVWNHGSVRF